MTKIKTLHALIFSLTIIWHNTLAQNNVDYHVFRETQSQRTLEENQAILSQWILETEHPDSLQRLFIDSELSKMRNDSVIWSSIVQTLKEQYINSLPKMELPDVSFMLWVMGAEDQKNRSLKRFYTDETPAFGTPEFKSYQAANRKKSQEQIGVILKLMQQHDGWLTVRKVGEPGERACFFIVQHAENQVRKKTLPLLKKAVEEGESPPEYYALMHDRYQIFRGKKQLYGSQLSIENGVYKLDRHIVIDKLNENRKSIGLATVQEYVLDAFGEKIYEQVFGTSP
jgi:hypothetical protein